MACMYETWWALMRRRHEPCKRKLTPCEGGLKATCHVDQSQQRIPISKWRKFDSLSRLEVPPLSHYPKWSQSQVKRCHLILFPSMHSKIPKFPFHFPHSDWSRKSLTPMTISYTPLTKAYISWLLMCTVGAFSFPPPHKPFNFWFKLSYPMLPSPFNISLYPTPLSLV